MRNARCRAAYAPCLEAFRAALMPVGSCPDSHPEQDRRSGPGMHRKRQSASLRHGRSLLSARRQPRARARCGSEDRAGGSRPIRAGVHHGERWKRTKRAAAPIRGATSAAANAIARKMMPAPSSPGEMSSPFRTQSGHARATRPATGIAARGRWAARPPDRRPRKLRCARSGSTPSETAGAARHDASPGDVLRASRASADEIP
jgi:hypothetical protein